MNPDVASRYEAFAGSLLGGASLVLLALAGGGAVALWTWRGPAERRLVGTVAMGMALLVVGLYVLLTDIGWWGGGFVHATPRPVQFVLVLALSFAAWTAWLAGYGPVARRVRAPLLVYLILTVIASQLVVAADRADLGAGLFIEHRGQSLWWGDIVFASMLFVLPLVSYEVLASQWRRDVLP